MTSSQAILTFLKKDDNTIPGLNRGLGSTRSNSNAYLGLLQLSKIFYRGPKIAVDLAQLKPPERASAFSFKPIGEKESKPNIDNAVKLYLQSQADRWKAKSKKQDDSLTKRLGRAINSH